ncbi:response regulator [Brooklawnia cerclae]|uniref:Transcriptional regulatory protein n=1 Tax=Brooklawnia cerclae TaxID=349934 RepID=A0ABX0SG85_9ACTN|nr:response regulator [Brooklawnia cerclae]NIH56220.1 response regulator of citrate/malate metabolism [Brooklawnia cerclae]
MIRVLVVDDQRTVAEGHRTLVERVPGFEVVAVAYNGPQAVERCAAGGVDLVLLDLAMPGMSGLEVARALQAMPDGPDVMVLTASRDLHTVRAAMRGGALHYVLKPFSFATLQAKLVNYARFTQAAAGQRDVLDQGEIDSALAALRDPSGTAIAKGMSKETLAAVREALLAEPDGLTETRAAEAVGISRVTARRYLEYLSETGGCERVPVYGRTGRPELVYRPRG